MASKLPAKKFEDGEKGMHTKGGGEWWLVAVYPVLTAMHYVVY